MEVYSKIVPIKGKNYTVRIPELDLFFTSDPTDLLIERPFHTGQLPTVNSTEQLYKAGWEDMKFRGYAAAKENFLKVLEQDPFHMNALLGLGELFYRQGLYKEGLEYVQKALRLDTYHPKANYVAGILYRGKGDYLNAKEALGWAARSMEFRSNAFAQMGELLLAEGQLTKAKTYVQKALNFNQHNINAWQVLAIVARLTSELEDAEKALTKIEELDPINHFSKFEQYLLEPSEVSLNQFKNSHRSELAYQTYLELAIDYFNKGQLAAAIGVLEAAPQHPMVDLWWTYIKKEEDSKYLSGIGSMSPAFVFPFRRETLAVLEWGNLHFSNWKLKYYYALNLWGKDRKAEAAALLESIGNRPDYAVFYLTRATLLKDFEEKDPEKDLTKALQLDRSDWRIAQALIQYYGDKEGSRALNLAEKAYQQFPENYALGMDYVNMLNQSENYTRSLEVLNQLHVLPFEGAYKGRVLYEEAHYGEALKLIEKKEFKQAISLLEKAKLWPEILGVGKPYNPDERLPNYLLAYCYQEQGNPQMAQEYWTLVKDHSQQHISQFQLNHLFGLKAIEKMEGRGAALQWLENLQLLYKDESKMDWIRRQYLGVEPANDIFNKNQNTSKTALIKRVFDYH